MKSAYAILGVPGNAGGEEIRQAYEQASKFYSKEKLIENPSLSERLGEVKEAYKILSTPDLRQMHDRKLSSAVSLPQAGTMYVPSDEEPGKGRMIKVMVFAIVAMFAIGTYYSHVREEGRKAKLANELTLKRQADEAERKAAQEQAAKEVAKERAEAVADNRERQLRADSFVVGRQIQANQTTELLLQERKVQAERNAELQAERQRKYEADKRKAETQQQLRNLCMQNYGRSNC